MDFRGWPGRLALAAALFVGTCAAQAQSCPVRFQFVFADGEKGCLTDSALADETVPGWNGNLRRMVPNSGNFNLAVAPRSGQCAGAIGFASTHALSSQPLLGPSTESRSAAALADCQARVLALGKPAAACACRVVLEDGNSPLTRAAFLALTATGAQVTAGAAPAAVEAAPAAALAAAPPPSPAATTPVPLAPSADILALRQQLEALQSQVNRQATAAETPKAAPPRQKVRALVIGNGAYQHIGALPNPRRDAEAVAAKLRGFGVDVDLLLDADRPRLVQALNDYHKRAVGDDVNIFFYAGHGLQVAGINYIVPVDMRGEGVSAGSVKLNGVSLNDALDYLPGKTRLVFLDACRDNPLARSLLATRSVAALGLAPMAGTTGTLISYATKDGATAEDGNGRNSPYTEALLKHIDVPQDIAVVLRRVRQSVMQATSNRQEPWEYGSLVGDELILSRLAR